MNYPTSPEEFDGWHTKFMAELHEAYAKLS
jgi:hypothetical protein